jgi:hypothetical protein
MTLQLGPFPTVENNCTMWYATYRDEGRIVAVKDYQLCRRDSDQDLFTDEGKGIILDSQWIGDQLITPYRVDNIIYIAIDRLRGDIFQEEIITVNDKDSTEKIQLLQTQTVYRTIMKRVELEIFIFQHEH